MFGIDKYFYSTFVTVLANSFETMPNPFVFQLFIGAERLLCVDFLKQREASQSTRFKY